MGVYKRWPLANGPDTTAVSPSLATRESGGNAGKNHRLDFCLAFKANAGRPSSRGQSQRPSTSLAPRPCHVCRPIDPHATAAASERRTTQASPTTPPLPRTAGTTSPAPPQHPPPTAAPGPAAAAAAAVAVGGRQWRHGPPPRRRGILLPPAPFPMGGRHCRARFGRRPPVAPACGNGRAAAAVAVATAARGGRRRGGAPATSIACRAWVQGCFFFFSFFASLLSIF